MQSRDIIKEMLEERQQLLVAFCRLTGAEPFVEGDVPALQQLADFCQALMDYAGIVHFEIFEKLADEGGGQLAVRDRARRLYDPLVDNTESLVDFNDRYEVARPGFALDGLSDDLSRLGEQLATRFELEDALVVLLREVDGS